MNQPALQFRVVDAFAWEAFSGNPAGVILDAAGLSDAQMQAIAREINASETTFVLPPQSDAAAVRFRWFTPGVEVNFCGHATLGAVHALLEAGRFANVLRDPGTVLPIESKSGVLTVRTEFQDHPSARCVYWLDALDATVRPCNYPAEAFAPFLGIGTDALDERLPAVMTADRDVIFGVRELATLLAMRPEMQKLGEFCLRQRFRGVLVTSLETPSPTIACQSRFFAPAAGVAEDPVTGSVHGPLGAYLVERGQVPAVGPRTAFQCAQGEPGGRAGVVRVVVNQEADRYRARIGGACVTTAQGTMVRPGAG
ncbi:MAG: PhzF family phenazine biosynthesis protein [Phycisphaerae bacterium]|nr:PhzF family phenazine biosynthesis protein [Phycisphaerae bacterium]NUQ47735.1 PhzF family phenazine biosynthesis protein [Phycisphaerae bacterium]